MLTKEEEEEPPHGPFDNINPVSHTKRKEQNYQDAMIGRRRERKGKDGASRERELFDREGGKFPPFSFNQRVREEEDDPLNSLGIKRINN